MSIRELNNRKFKSILYFGLMLLTCAICLTALVFELIILAVIFGLLEFVSIGMFAMSFNYKNNAAKYEKIKAEIEKAITKNPIPINDILNVYKYKGLDIIEKPILKLFYSSDKTQRCFFVQDSNAVKRHLQKIFFEDDETKTYNLDFARWETTDYDNSYYADIAIALKENEKILSDFKEDKFDIAKRKHFFAEIDWGKNNISSDIVKFGYYNFFDIKIGDQLIENVRLHNATWYELNYSGARVYYLKDANVNLEKSFKFCVLLQGQIVAKGKHYKRNYTK